MKFVTALWSKSNQSSGQSNRSNKGKKKKPKCKPEPEDICQDYGGKGH